MKQITFTITKGEIQKYSEEKLSDRRIKQILETIENDDILWKHIEESIKAAIDVV